MTIEVINKGTPPMDKKYKCRCQQCNSTLSFLRSDVQQESSPRNESYYRFRCPVCNEDLYININSAKEIT